MKPTFLIIVLLFLVLSAQSQEILIHKTDGNIVTIGLIDIDSITFSINTDTIMNIPCPGTPTVTDDEGNVYNTVLIGSQCWMAENLNIGTTIYSTTGGKLQTDNSIIEKYCYNNILSNCLIYGGLYEWDEMMQYNPSDNQLIGTTQGICPEGWHLPTDEEWKSLERYLGMSHFEASNTGYRGTTEGGKLKESGHTHWSPPNEGATNESGFTSLPGGYRDYVDGSFGQMNTSARFWTATEYNDTEGWRRAMTHDHSSVWRAEHNKNYGRSVRCVKDL